MEVKGDSAQAFAVEEFLVQKADGAWMVIWLSPNHRIYVMKCGRALESLDRGLSFGGC